MNLQYSNTANAVYIDLLGGSATVDRTVEIDSGTMVDVDASERVVGIEIINPARAWPLEDVLDRFEIGESDAATLRALRDAQALTGQVSLSLGGATGASAELQLA